MLKSDHLHDGSTMLIQWFSYEIVNENKINLYTDKEHKNDQCFDIEAETNFEQISLTRE